jgi:hypothetical protein
MNENEIHGPKGKKSEHSLIPEEKKLLLKEDRLNSDDWKVLKEIITIIKPFYVYIKRAEGKSISSDRGVFSEYIVTLNKLLNYVQL